MKSLDLRSYLSNDEDEDEDDKDFDLEIKEIDDVLNEWKDNRDDYCLERMWRVNKYKIKIYLNKRGLDKSRFHTEWGVPVFLRMETPIIYSIKQYDEGHAKEISLETFHELLNDIEWTKMRDWYTYFDEENNPSTLYLFKDADIEFTYSKEVELKCDYTDLDYEAFLRKRAEEYEANKVPYEEPKHLKPYVLDIYTDGSLRRRE